MRFIHETTTWRPGYRTVDTLSENISQRMMIRVLRYGHNVISRSAREQHSHQTSSGNRYFSGRSGQ